MQTSDFAFVALIRDQDGNLVRKVSRQYRLSHAKDASTPGDSILFYREVRLDPGRYTVTVAGFDAIAGAGGISRSEIGLPERDPKLPEISSLVLVDRAEKMTGDRAVPLRVGDVGHAGAIQCATGWSRNSPSGMPSPPTRSLRVVRNASV
ncbi:MAG: hypothetical protein WAO20_12655 [Acidobacteriota bacterium]